MTKRSVWRRALAVAFSLSLLLGMTPSATLAIHNTADPHGFILRVGSGYNYHIPVCPPFFFPHWDLDYPYHTRINEAMSEWNSLGGEAYFYRSNTSCDSLEANQVPHIKIGWDTQMGFAAGGYATTRRHNVAEYSPEAEAWSTGWGFSDPPRYDGECPTEIAPGAACTVFAEIALDYADHSLMDWSSTGPSSNEVSGKGIVLHELGHPLGLSDVPMVDLNDDAMWPCEDRVFPASYNAVMCSAILLYERRWTLRSHDITAYNSKY